MTLQAMVIGHPIQHSRSPLLHNTGYRILGLDWRYSAHDCVAEQVPDFVASLDSSVRGISVTMPAKFAALALADKRTQRAQVVGSANTLVRCDAGWLADNTDIDGIYGCFAELFAGEERQALTGKTAVIIGSGGTARPAIWAACSLGAGKIVVLNRRDRSAEFADVMAHFPQTELHFRVMPDFGQQDFSPEGQELWEEVGKAAVVVNTVPGNVVAPLAPLVADVPTVDVIYDPWPTPLVVTAKQVVGGHIMLAHQAFAQFELFTGKQPPRREMLQALEQDLGIVA